MILGIIINFIFSLWVIPEYLGKKRKIGFTWSLVACVFLTPLIGLIITLFSPKLDEHKNNVQIRGTELSYGNKDKSDKNSILENLLEQGLLTQEEYEDKLNKLNEKRLSDLTINSQEYSNLKELLDNKLLTKDEFENKIIMLRTNIKNKTDLLASKNSGIIITTDFIDGLAVAIDDELNYGFANANGEIIIETKYEYAEQFKNELALVRINRMFGYIDKNGIVIIPTKFNSAESFSRGKANVSIGNEEFFIDKEGNKIS